MNDQPESHNKKIHFDHLAHLYDEPKFYMSELEFLEQKIEAKLDKINEEALRTFDQLSVLFQLSEKLLRDSIDATIDTDNNVIKFEALDRAINDLKITLKDIQTKLNR